MGVENRLDDDLGWELVDSGLGCCRVIIAFSDVMAMVMMMGAEKADGGQAMSGFLVVVVMHVIA